MQSPVAHIVGSVLEGAQPDGETHEWCFTFGGGMQPRVSSPWRLMTGGRIVLGWEDHGHPGTRTVVAQGGGDVESLG